MFSRLARLAAGHANRFLQRRSPGYFAVEFTKFYRAKSRANKYNAPRLPFYLAALWGVSKAKEEDKTAAAAAAKELLYVKADALFDREEYQEIYKLLSIYRDSKDVEILWRMGRTLYKLSKQQAKEADAKRLIYEAYDLICEALSLREDHWAVHKWVAILLNTKTGYEGTKIKIKELYRIKKHMLRASELNPKDATTLYMIGNWCYQVADLAWYQRKIASAIFGEPPTSSFEEALQYFEQAENVDPSFYGHNLLMLGKTYLKLNKRDEAIKYLKLASDYPASNDDDLEAKREAMKILSHI